MHGAPVLDVMAIDNLPSLLPVEASEDFAAQLLPHLLETLDVVDTGSGAARARNSTGMCGLGLDVLSLKLCCAMSRGGVHDRG